MAEYYDELPDEDINKWDHWWREEKRREEKERFKLGDDSLFKHFYIIKYNDR